MNANWIIQGCPGCGRKLAVQECTDWMDPMAWCTRCGGRNSADHADIERVERQLVILDTPGHVSGITTVVAPVPSAQGVAMKTSKSI